MSEIVQLVEDRDVRYRSPIAIEGLPDVGLVGTIAGSHMVEQLGLSEVAHLESDAFPPVMVLHDGVLRDPVRIYGNENLLLLTSEIPLPIETLNSAARTITRWFKSKNVKLAVSLSGIPVRERVEIKTPNVYSVANNPDSRDFLKNRGIDVMEEGFIAGIYAVLLKESSKIQLPAVALLSQSFLKYPDPGAAASVIQALNKLIGVSVDVKNLLEKGDEIRVKARDLMKQAEGSIADMQKPVEQGIPIMYR
jgi:uncharacterized protein